MTEEKTVLIHQRVARRKAVVSFFGAALAIVLVIAVFTILATIKNGTGHAKWDHFIRGKFVISEFEENYDSYLESLGIADYVFPLLKDESMEKVVVMPPETPNGLWTISTSTELGASLKLEFLLGEAFQAISSDLHNDLEPFYLCDRPTTNELSCHLRDIARDWRVRIDMNFDVGGFTERRTDLSSNVTGVKHFQRLSF